MFRSGGLSPTADIAPPSGPANVVGGGADLSGTHSPAIFSPTSLADLPSPELVLLCPLRFSDHWRGIPGPARPAFDMLGL